MLTNLTTTIMIVFAGGPHTPERTALACELLTSRPPPAIIYLTGVEYRGEYSNLADRVRSIASTLPTHPKVLTDDCRTTWASCLYLARELQTADRCEALGGRTSREPQPQEESRVESPKSKVTGTRVSLSAVALAKEEHLTITVITSNYHAPRVRWLLSGVLPAFCQTGKEKSFEQKPAKTAKGRELVSAGGGEETSSLCALCPSVKNSDPPFSISRHASHSLHLTSHISPLTILTTPDIPWREAFATPRNRQLIWGECLSWLYCGPLGLIYRPWLLGLAGILMAGAVMLGIKLHS
ncbi:MAG: hypothetical protein WCI03_01030 [bacterium]